MPFWDVLSASIFCSTGFPLKIRIKKKNEARCDDVWVTNPAPLGRSLLAKATVGSFDCLTICCNVGNHGKPKNKPTTWGWFIMFITPVYAVIFDLFLSPLSKRSFVLSCRACGWSQMTTVHRSCNGQTTNCCRALANKTMPQGLQALIASMKMAGCDLCSKTHGPAIPGTPRLGDITNAFLNLVAGQQPLGSSWPRC